VETYVAAFSLVVQFRSQLKLSYRRMIRRFVFAAALAASTPALACQCEDSVSLSNADSKKQANWIASSGASIAEVELVRTELGDQYRTVRPLVRQAPRLVSGPRSSRAIYQLRLRDRARESRHHGIPAAGSSEQRRTNPVRTDS
jgi:hypothetical protein